MRKRADILLVERGFFSSRARAQAAIAAGLVSVGGAALKKASEEVADDASIEAEAPHPWASRGGVKLAAALDAFALDPSGLVCLDVGASTGGFTDVLLGARRGEGYCGRRRPRTARLRASLPTGASFRSKAWTRARSRPSVSANGRTRS